MTWIKKAYLYVVSLVSLIIIMVGAITLLNMGLKILLNAEEYYSYPMMAVNCQVPVEKGVAVKTTECDPDYQIKQQEYEKKNQQQQRKRDIAQSLAMIIVGTPVFYYHWKLARKEA
ncbi:MAG: Uncharacterized protein G01um101477_527 [Candidatus Doudnabacteria bacterium Gr01-1014_77]|uniref:DUF5671 domain-containing protein n=1 Tax=Candidatus Doudnabacteria bacterium Gr01-1014_77 TaxID=2017133 RepID=A0A554JAC7_9BACT|nr:MAG: Uncharacterized protein G01um101477_527 [Candidatus Doudnabacteria bacterium Gr01-1014_77]